MDAEAFELNSDKLKKSMFVFLLNFYAQLQTESRILLGFSIQCAPAPSARHSFA